MAEYEIEEEGENYFASVSDLMVGILFVFLLMLTVFALNYRQAENDQRASLAELNQAKAAAVAAQQVAAREMIVAESARDQAARLKALLVTAMAQLQRDIEDRTIARDRLLTTLETTLRQHGVLVSVDQQAGILHLPGDLLFESLSASLAPRPLAAVRILADALAQTLPCFTPTPDRTLCDPGDLPLLETVMIEGHTDRVPIGANSNGFRNNDQLSTERALAVFAELRRTRPLLDALRSADDTYPLLGVSGFGERRPLTDAQGGTPAEYARNRRIDLRFVLAARGSTELERVRGEIETALKEEVK